MYSDGMAANELFRDDSYLKSCSALVTLAEKNALYVDQTVFYPLGGGQPGDTGTLSWNDGAAKTLEDFSSSFSWLSRFFPLR